MRIAGWASRFGLACGILGGMRSLTRTVGPVARPVATVLAGLCVAGTLTACSGADSDATAETSLVATTSVTESDSGTGSPGAGTSPGAGGVSVGSADPQPVRGTVDVIRLVPHDPALFTQGLEVVGNDLYESTGQYGQSQVLRSTFGQTEPTVRVDMAPDEFGEGLTVTPDALWTLTWRNNVAHARDPQTLEVRETVEYAGEGWGLCYDDTRLVMSDGTDTLTFRDPVTFEPTGTVAVTAGGTPVPRLNELECVDGDVLANVWMTNEIIRIDPTTGAVTAIYDASELGQPRPANPDAVLNGIAALGGSDTLLVGGKLWPNFYEVRLVG